MNWIIVALVSLLAVVVVCRAEASQEDEDLIRLLPLINAIAAVETGGLAEKDRDKALGDPLYNADKTRFIKWRARGRYQIHESYWADAKMDSAWDVGAHNSKKSRLAIVRYMRRYAPDAVQAMDWHTLARIHNGGPQGAKKESTVKYWEKVRQHL